jgi:bifunctional UDP-N-acetylglucosamine pyrophosphorylase/glucosamine-1-phosphate N-acetyltransferase
MADQLAAVVMAGGIGTRMKSATPKHLHPLLGRRMVDWVVEAAREAGVERLVVVASPQTSDLLEGVEVAVQEEPLGTGDAVRSARAALDGFDGDVLVLNGDVPALRPETIRALVETHRAAGAAATVLSFEPADAGAYGRVVRDGDGRLARIVEAADATPEELAVREVNSGIYAFRAEKLWPALERLDSHNAQGELYVTDTLGLLVADGDSCAVLLAGDPLEAEGVNTRAELAAAAAVLRDRINLGHMRAGSTIVDPATTWIDPTVELEPDCTIQPFTVLRGGTRVARGAEVGPHVVAVDTEIGSDALVGPFCYLRPGTVLETGAKAGAFVEIKNSRIGERTKVPHQSYIGDAEIGANTNIAAGNITVNFPHQPGKPKGRTTIGRNVRTGVHNAFVAPVEIGDDAWIGAGSVITEDVPPESLAVARARQENKEGYVRRKREQEDE